MANEASIIIAGNLTDDPELRFTPSGAAVVKFRVAQTPRLMDRTTNEWKDGEPVFLSCQAWRQLAENIAESLVRGSRVLIEGKLRMRTYETAGGEKRTVFEVEVEEIGASLKYATTKIHKVARGGEGGGNASQSRTVSKATAKPAERSAPAQAAASPADDW